MIMQLQSINQNLYSAPSRSLLRGAPDPGQAEKNSLEKVEELRIVTAVSIVQNLDTHTTQFTMTALFIGQHWALKKSKCFGNLPGKIDFFLTQIHDTPDFKPA